MQEVLKSDVIINADIATPENEDVPPMKQEGNDDDESENEEDGGDGEPTTLCEVMEVLNDIDTPGSTCAAGPASCLPSLPGLHVEGVGDILLPISDAQAKLLVTVADQAPHGKGMETIIDTSVRNTLRWIRQRSESKTLRGDRRSKSLFTRQQKPSESLPILFEPNYTNYSSTSQGGSSRSIGILRKKKGCLQL